MVAVTYYCPRCEALAELERDAYLADKCVTPDPLDGWEYVPAWDTTEGDAPYGDAEGVEIVCGATETDGDGCGQPYYLSFVTYEDGEERNPHVSLSDANFDFLGR